MYTYKYMDKETLLKKFGKNVRIERIKQDLSQQQLADIMKVGQGYLASIERGKENMSLGKVLELAEYLNVDIEKLLTFK